MEAPEIFQRVMDLLNRFKEDNPSINQSGSKGKISEQDVILITYGDMVQQVGEKPLETLGRFLAECCSDMVTTVHILPFYPYSSDDGFSVIDYRQVNPKYGDWGSIAKLNKDFRLMFDAVVNHISAQSDMFQSFLKGDRNYESFFTIVEPGTDLSQVFRPRATPVLTPFDTVGGEKLVWTTFSADQIDLNYQNPEVLLEVLNILLFYIAQGAEFIRLDAVTFVWKEIGTSCINLPQTHRVVQLMRTVLDLAAPNVVIITETNVPHKDNIAYFGDGTNEAQMVYNFALPLLTLHSFLSEDVRVLSEWACTLDLPSDQTTFFNFLACHDGIGVMPVIDILSEDDLDQVITQVKANGGRVSYKSNADGTKSPYELNINYLDALRDPNKSEEEIELIVNRFLATQSIMLSLRGVPGIYFHSMFGSQNWNAGVKITGRYRTINREKLNLAELEVDLSNPDSLRARIYLGYRYLLSVRRAHLAFHPFGRQDILELHPKVFGLLRSSLDGADQMLCFHNVSNQKLSLLVDLQQIPLNSTDSLLNVLTDQNIPITEDRVYLKFEPYQIIWLKVE
jgi:sucrose phosphorylase